MSDISRLLEEIRLLRGRVEALEERERERDLEERAAYLQVVAAIERRHKLEPRDRRPRGESLPSKWIRAEEKV